jgi:hypothetical protein
VRLLYRMNRSVAAFLRCVESKENNPDLYKCLDQVQKFEGIEILEGRW